MTGTEVIGVPVASVPKYYCDLSQVWDKDLPKLSMKDLRKDKMEDPLYGLTVKALEGRCPDLLNLRKKQVIYMYIV